MNRITVVSAVLLAGLAGSTAAYAAKDPCVNAPDGLPSSTSMAGIADPGPCKVSTGTKSSKNAKSSKNGKSPGNGNGNGNGNSNGSGSDNGQDNSDESIVKQGLAIAPVTLNLEGRNRALVGKGSYMVNAVGGCNDCHTWPNYAPGGDPYTGAGPKAINAQYYLAGGRPFGPFRSRNLTPKLNETESEADRYAEFVSVMRTGVDPDLAHPQISPLLQVMPWPVYQDMTDNDLRAIFEYLQAIPHAEPYCAGPKLAEAVCQP
jgi:hypothetical protein